jgi:hypothetical protein
MALKCSTGLRNFLTGEGSFRKAFEDAVLKIYSGVAPASPDDAETGTLLAKITKSSGTVAAGERGTPRLYQIEISGTPDAGDVVKLLVDGAAYDYTLLAEDNTLAKVAIKVARMLNDIPYLDAVPVGDTGFLHVKGRIDGLDLTIAENTSTGITVAVTAKQAAVRPNTLQFGAPASGVISKNADIWSGLGIAPGGTAGYFRLVTSQDTGAQSTTEVRLQGNVSTSGAELNLSNLAIVAGATQTIDGCEFTLPIS